MKKTVILLSAVILGLNTVQAAVKDTEQLNYVKAPSGSNNIHNIAVYHGINYQQLMQAERAILGRTYEQQDVDIRLNRLERTVFGQVNTHMNNAQRLNYLMENSYNAGAVSPGNLARVEERILGRVFNMDTPKNRIERLEQNMFGAVQSGDLATRYETIGRAASQYRPVQNQYQQVQLPQIPTTAKGWKNAATNFLLGSGVPTGMTPQVNWDTFGTDWGNQGAGGQSNYYTGNTGYGYNNRSTGSGTGVHILD